MLTQNLIHIDQPLILTRPHLDFQLPEFLRYNMPIAPIVLPKERKSRAYSAGEEEGKGKWTKIEQKAYILFLEENKQEMGSKSSRKSQKVFLKMSLLVKTRSPDQCRSHHQKVLKYHGKIDEIIKFYTQNLNKFQVDEKWMGFDKSFTKRTRESDSN